MAQEQLSSGIDESLLHTLRGIVGAAHVLTRDEVFTRATHFWDASGMVAGALVRPANTNETAQVVKACNDTGQSVVTHGGLTGLVDGNRSTESDLVISLERQKTIEQIDPLGRTITVQAGAVLQQIQEQAQHAGLQLGLDLGARGSCTIGGNIATNAGGLSVLRYGMTREQVLGLEVVLADGSVLSSMNTLMKNNAGYDLKHLFIGSEGTLGIITRAVLRLRPPTPLTNTALLAFDNFANVASTLRTLDTALDGTLDAFEVMWPEFYKLNTDPQRSDTVSAPLSRDYPLYAIIEQRSASKETDKDVLQLALEHLMENNLLLDAVVANSSQQAESIWRIREHIEIALEPDTVFVYDISLPIAAMEQYLKQLHQQVKQRWPSAALHVYGHLADSNLHVLVTPWPDKRQTSKPDNTNSTETDPVNHQLSEINTPLPEDSASDQNANNIDDEHAHCNQMVYEPLQNIGGSISAEHGIGLYKKAHLSLSRSPQEIALMKTLKRTLDPKNIFNPGKTRTIHEIDKSFCAPFSCRQFHSLGNTICITPGLAGSFAKPPKE